MKEITSRHQLLPRWNPSQFPYTVFDLLRYPRAPTTRLAIIAVVIAWVPTALFAAFRSFDALRSFLRDYAAQSRLLIVIPLLILTEPALVARLQAVAQHFRDEGLIRKEDRPHFDNAFNALKRLGNSPIVKIFMVLLVYIFLVSVWSVTTSSSLMPWCFGAGGIGNLSPAGSCYILVGIAITLFIFLRWVWHQILWLRFLGVISRMDLQLIPSHPDHAGGLGFVEQCMRGYLPFSFATGTIVSGGLMNRVEYLGQPVTAFRYIPILVIAIVLLLCVGPFCVLWGTLVRTRSRGIFEYGALATSMGRQFESKWIAAPGKEDGRALEVQDFSATTDLYSVAANVHHMKLFPFGMQSVSRLVVAALVPSLPLTFVAFPPDVIVKSVIKLFL